MGWTCVSKVDLEKWMGRWSTIAGEMDTQQTEFSQAIHACDCSLDPAIDIQIAHRDWSTLRMDQSRLRMDLSILRMDRCGLCIDPYSLHMKAFRG